MSQNKQDGPNLWGHSTYKGVRIERVPDGVGYHAECRGVFMQARTLSGIRYTITALLTAPEISWRTVS